MSAARKPVIVRKLTREWFAGFTNSTFSPDDQELELLDPSGKLLRIAWPEVKWVCFVREPTASAPSEPDPERLLRRRFAGRPRMKGLWLRLILADGEELEGVASNDRSLVDGSGLMLTPPDTRSNTQRIFVPRSGIRDLTVLGVIGAVGPATAHRADRTENALQPDLFQPEPEEA